jgi:hypothetical protein
MAEDASGSHPCLSVYSVVKISWKGNAEITRRRCFEPSQVGAGYRKDGLMMPVSGLEAVA